MAPKLRSVAALTKHYKIKSDLVEELQKEVKHLRSENKKLFKRLKRHIRN